MFNIEITAKVLASITEEQLREILANALKQNLAKAKREDYSPKSNEEVHKITEFMCKMGVPTHIRGYEYLREAIFLVYMDSSYIHSITGRLSTDIAKKFGSTPSRVERAIRYAIELTVRDGNPEVIEMLFGTQKAKLKNGKVIAGIVEYIKHH